MITLTDIWAVPDPLAYKVHLASRNRDGAAPLDALAKDPEGKGEWRGWQEHRGKRNRFNRKYIFSLARDYAERDTWMFGGVFEVTARTPHKYCVSLTEQLGAFILRLKLQVPDYRGQQRSVNLERILDSYGCEVLEVLREPYR